jgi:hypothetical protein
LAVSRLEGSHLKPALHENRVALLQMVGTGGADTVERANSIPVRDLFGIVFPVLEPPIHGHAEIYDMVATWQIFHLWRSAEIANNLDFAESEHEFVSLIDWWWPADFPSGY